MKKHSILVAACIALLSSSCVYAEDFEINSWTADHIKVGATKNADGSAMLLSTESPHSGKQCLKLVYNLQNGNVEYVVNPTFGPPLLPDPNGGLLKLSFWVKGDPSSKLLPMVVRLVDAQGQMFQYSLRDSEKALLNKDWTLYTTNLDLNKSDVHFGGPKDGVLHFPLKLISFSMQTLESDSGTIYMDDLSWEALPPEGK